jgi:hypothetical protein
MSENTSDASLRFAANSANGIDASDDVGCKGALDLLRAWRDGRTPDPAYGFAVGRQPPPAQPARRQRRRPLAHQPDALPARHHGRAVANASDSTWW